MASDSPGEWDWAERWDQLFHVLSADPRRMLIYSLMDEPKERRLPLPDAAMSPNQPMDSETLRIELRHHHLPVLAEAGYIRWEEDPFCVQRGPCFEEIATVLGRVCHPVEQLPNTLIQNCKVLQRLHSDA